MIYIITSSVRVKNLPTIAETIPSTCKWIVIIDRKAPYIPRLDMKNSIVIDAETKGFKNSKGRNFILDNWHFNDNDWIYALDDDNIIHPDWFFHIDELVDNIPDNFSMINWGIVDRYNNVVGEPGNTEPNKGNQDTASYMFKWQYAKNIRYINDYASDGQLAYDLSQVGDIYHINEYLGYFNYITNKPHTRDNYDTIDDVNDYSIRENH